MRSTEMIHFLRENPTKDEMHLYTHIDVPSLKKKMKEDKEFGKFVRKCRKEWKKNEA